MTEHAVGEIVAVKESPEFLNVVGKVLRRNHGIFGKCYRLGIAFGVAEKAHCLLAHGVYGKNVLQFGTGLITDNSPGVS